MLPNAFIDEILKFGIDSVIGVPDSLLKNLLRGFQSSLVTNVTAANEGSAVSIAVGKYLATGKVPIVYMQNSGLGNAINPLSSLAHESVSAVPLLCIVGWRGETAVKDGRQDDEPQHLAMGRATRGILESLNIPILELKSIEDIGRAFALTEERRPVVLLVRKGTFEAPSIPASAASIPSLGWQREDVIQTVAKSVSTHLPIVSTTGMASRELNELDHRSFKSNFLVVGAMGHANQIAYGLASELRRDVICLDGDGALLMHSGGLATSATAEHLIHITINNRCHDSVGGQPTSAPGVGMCKLADAFGYQYTFLVKTARELSEALHACEKVKGSRFIEVLCDPGYRADLGRPIQSPRENREQFMNWLDANGE